MTQQSMVVMGHGVFAPNLYTLTSLGSGLVSITVLCNLPRVPFWGTYFGVAATLGVPQDTYTTLWSDVLNHSVTVTLDVTGATVASLGWSTS